MDDNTRTELEAAAFRRLLAHLRERTDVQNIDLMNLAGFCRNCLSAGTARKPVHAASTLPTPRRARWSTACPTRSGRRNYHKEASGEQKKAFDAAQREHG